MSGQRVLPHNLDAEKSVLGGILLRNESINQIENIVEDDFYDPRNKAVFAAMRILEDKAKPIDPVTLEEELARVGKLDAIGGMSYLSELAIAVPTADNISHYAEIVTDKSTARKLMLASSDIAAKGYGDYGEITEYLDEAEQKIFEITQRNQRGGAESIKSLLVSLFKDLGTRQTDGIAGVPSYFNDLDKKTAGLHPSDLVILAARPAMGKTSLALSIAHNCAMQGGWPVLVFSLEMSSLQLTERMLCSEARIEAFALRAGMLNRQHMSNLTFAANRISAAPIYIDDTPALSLREARAKARRWVGNKEIFKDKDHGLIVVDYLQLMRGSTSNKNSNREQEISEISRGLKSLAKELNCPVLALSQLNRGVEQRDDKRPRMSDLRECVTGDTLVCLADGRRVPIETLVGQTPTVLAMTPEGRIAPAESDKVWRVGRRPVFDVALASGRHIRTTAKHRLYGAAGWQRVSQLQAGDRLAHEKRGDLFWDRIVSIEPAGEEEVYDLTVPGPASWLADGVVSHNSGAIEQDADMILFIYRDEVYNEDTQAKGVAEVIVGKNRHGPIGTAELKFEGKFTRFDNLSMREDDYGGPPPPDEPDGPPAPPEDHGGPGTPF